MNNRNQQDRLKITRDEYVALGARYGVMIGIWSQLMENNNHSTIFIAGIIGGLMGVLEGYALSWINSHGLFSHSDYSYPDEENRQYCLRK